MSTSGSTRHLLMIVAILAIVALVMAVRAWRKDDRVTAIDNPDAVQEHGVISVVNDDPGTPYLPPPDVEPIPVRGMPGPRLGADTQPNFDAERIQAGGRAAGGSRPGTSVFATGSPATDGRTASTEGGPGPVLSIPEPASDDLPNWFPPPGNNTIPGVSVVAQPLPTPRAESTQPPVDDPNAWLTGDTPALPITTGSSATPAIPLPVGDTSTFYAPPPPPPVPASSGSGFVELPSPGSPPSSSYGVSSGTASGSTGRAAPEVSRPTTPTPPARTIAPVPYERPLASPPSPSGPREYVVRSGDTLSGIAARELGREGLWRDLYKLNQNRIENPNVLTVGTKLMLPGPVAPPAAGALRPAPTTAPTTPIATRGGTDTGRARVLKPGESLRDIAQNVYGDPNKAILIVQANSAALQKAGRPQAGMTLIIPPEN